jgi:hypothetical protein
VDHSARRATRRVGGVGLIGLVAGLLLLATADAARAEFVTMKLTKGPDSGHVFQYKLNGSNGSALAGLMHWTRTAGSAVPESFTTFCVELLQHVNIGGSYQYLVTDVEKVPYSGSHPAPPGHSQGMGADKADLVRKLWGTYRGSVVDADTEAAFQVAVWEIVNDPGLSIWEGTFRSKLSQANAPSWVALAQTWLDGLDDPTAKYAHDLIGLSHGERQDQITAAPAPPAAALMALGAVGLTLGAWRRRRARQST